MAVPTTKPRLTKLDPTAVAAEAMELIAAHLNSYIIQLFPVDFRGAPPADELRTSGLAHSIRALTVYAQSGQDAETDDHDVAASFAHDRVGDVLACVYASAVDQYTVDTSILDPDVDPDTALGCVLTAAWARTRLRAGESISRQQLASLASIDPQHVSLLARQGELRIDDGMVTAEEARRWLGARGVGTA